VRENGSCESELLRRNSTVERSNAGHLVMAVKGYQKGLLKAQAVSRPNLQILTGMTITGRKIVYSDLKGR